MATAIVRAQLRQALGEALKARDVIAVAALRSALGAIDDASAVRAGARPSPARAARTSLGPPPGLAPGKPGGAL